MDLMVELLIIVLMLAGNAVFAAYEMALASISRARLEVLLQANRRGARCAVYMKDRLEGSLAVIQLGITLAGAIAAATGGAGVDDRLAPWLERHYSLSEGVSEFLALSLFVLPLSAFTITFAELVPKMIGIRNKEAVVLALSPGMKAVSHVFYPVVIMLEAVVNRLMAISQRRWKTADTSSERSGLLELRAAASLARATRVIGPMEERIVMSAVQLSTRTVADAMVASRDIATIPAGASLEEALVAAHLHMHTRYPVCGDGGAPQNITGYVTFKDIVTALKIDPTGTGLGGIVRPMPRIGSTTSLAQALTDMIRDKVHIALVMDGANVCGLLTMEDIVEELVGDIHDEYDRLPAHIHSIGDGWLVGGGQTIGSIAKTMGAPVFTGIDANLTLADWVDRTREVSPRSGDTIRANGMEVLVRKMRRNRVAEAVVRTGARSQ